MAANVKVASANAATVKTITKYFEALVIAMRLFHHCLQHVY
jgi:hypothetical protein